MVNGYFPSSLAEALEIRSSHAVVPYAGGTDLMVEADENLTYLFIHNLPELRSITEDTEYIRLGAAVTYTEILEHPLAPALLKAAVAEIAAPAIRNTGTIGGNLGNGSAKADSVLIFFVMDALLVIANKNGRRTLPVKEFYKGRKVLDLQGDELIVEVLLPKKNICSYYYEKVGARKALAISRVAFAGLMNIKDGTILHCATAFGAVSDVVIRREDLDAMLVGKTVAEARLLKQTYLKDFDSAIVPIRGRVSAEYRKEVCLNLLEDFLTTNGI